MINLHPGIFICRKGKVCLLCKNILNVLIQPQEQITLSDELLHLTSLTAKCRFQRKWRISESASLCDHNLDFFILLCDTFQARFYHKKKKGEREREREREIETTPSRLLVRFSIFLSVSLISIYLSLPLSWPNRIDKSLTSTATVLPNRRAKTIHHLQQIAIW
jgi:hypothetical protein